MTKIREEALKGWKSCKERMCKNLNALLAKSIDNYPETTFYVVKSFLALPGSKSNNCFDNTQYRSIIERKPY